MASLQPPVGSDSAADDEQPNMFEVEFDGIDVDEFRHHAKRLHENGLPPLAIGNETSKRPWHRGVTGRGGVDAELDEIESWPEDVVRRIDSGVNGVLNLGIRMPVGGIGIDIDDYVTANGQAKHGLRTIAERSTRLGSLPLTYRLSARSFESGSGIRLYRVNAPDGWEARGELKAADGSPGHVEFIQRHHRLAVVPPSIRPDLGDGVRVRLYDERTGEEVPDGIVPPISEWAALPDAWRDAITKQARAGGGRGEATAEEVEQFRADCTEDYWPNLLPRIVKRVSDERDSTRNTARDELCRAARHARIGCFPWKRARDELEAAARESYAARGEADRFDLAEIDRLEQFAIGEALADDIEELQRRAAADLSWKPGGTAPEHVTPWENWMRIRRALDRNGGRIPMKPMDSDTNGELPDGRGDDKHQTPSGQRVIRWRTGSEVRDDVPEWGFEHNGKGCIQRATLALFAGRPGAGKSTGARWFASEFTRGTLGGCFYGEPQNVAYIASEESIEYMVKPSLRAHGADMSRIHFPHVEIDGQEVRLNSRDDEARLIKDLTDRGISVVFVDPVMSAIGSKVNINNNNEVRECIEPWSRIARAINGLVICIVHLTKAPGGDVVAAINGSSAFGEVARAVIAFAKDQQSTEGIRVLSQEKNNAGTEDLALEYVIESHRVETDAGKAADVGKFVIKGPSDRRVSDVLQVDPKDRNVAKAGTKMCEVLECVRTAGHPTAAATVAQALGLSSDMAGKYLRRLADTGFISKTGRGQFEYRERGAEA
ncbi:AAA family ATPase [Mycolicibacterium farcinogenes]|uniref:AAA family ATPase n=1 Tax=Mycolicibacterium farcinogenes TaxID=1802 RepID=A0ACD1FKV6_MYCFR|nr:AAA family ATPase [Mycolicibacterium farcinogenes]QZH67698.1 AAA family ATPase [Mycolicibacterium farcinogenes]